MKNIIVSISLLTFASAQATEWEPLNSEKNQSLEQYCSVISIMSGTIMKARQSGVSMENIMGIANKPLYKEITISSFEKPKMSVSENKVAIENEFKSQWMLKCLKEHPAGK